MIAWRALAVVALLLGGFLTMSSVVPLVSAFADGSSGDNVLMRGFIAVCGLGLVAIGVRCWTQPQTKQNGGFNG